MFSLQFLLLQLVLSQYPNLLECRISLQALQYRVVTICLFSFSCFINCQPKINPSVKVSVKSHCQGFHCSKISSYEWILYEQNRRDASIMWRRISNLQLITRTPSNSSDIVIKEGFFVGGNKYRLALFVSTTDGLCGMSAYDISVALPPTGGTCLIAPSSGTSLETDINLSCSNWKSESSPLSYQIQYRLQNGLFSVLYRGVNNIITTSWIPSGNSADNFTVKFIVTVNDKFGVSTSPTLLTSQVGG